MHRRILAVATLASLAVAGPVAVAYGAVGVVYGAVTAQGYPIVIQLNKTARKVVRADIGIELQCQMPPNVTIPDSVRNVPISAAGKFTAVQPVTRIPADPANQIPALDVSARMTGQVNRARTRITGTVQRKIVIYDPADPTGVKVFDSCDSGVLRYTAKN